MAHSKDGSMNGLPAISRETGKGRAEKFTKSSLY